MLHAVAQVGLGLLKLSLQSLLALSAVSTDQGARGPLADQDAIGAVVAGQPVQLGLHGGALRVSGEHQQELARGRKSTVIDRQLVQLRPAPGPGRDVAQLAEHS
jgi:hypothetical protein